MEKAGNKPTTSTATEIGIPREMTDDKGNLRGSNFYNYSPNVQPWVDLYGLSSGCNDGDEKDSKLINQKN